MDTGEIETRLNQLYKEFYMTLATKERAQAALAQINQAIIQLEQQKQEIAEKTLKAEE